MARTKCGEVWLEFAAPFVNGVDSAPRSVGFAVFVNRMFSYIEGLFAPLRRCVVWGVAVECIKGLVRSSKHGCLDGRARRAWSG